MILKNYPPAEFLHAEERNGYPISEDMKRVWAVELDMVMELLQICKRHNLRIYADGGTLLGAVRHKGFIPWDDDIDMMMPREDYDRLVEIAPTEFSYPHFFQTLYTDPRYGRRHAQVRNVETAEGTDFGTARYCRGIFIDIFPLDAFPDNPRAFSKHFRRIKAAKNRLKLTQRFFKHLPDFIYSFCRKHTKCLSDEFIYRNYEGILRSVSTDDNRLWSEVSLGYNISFLDGSDFGEAEYLDFEYIKIPAPHEWHKVLVRFFGKDYMTPRQAPSIHGPLKFNAEKSYRAIYKKVLKG